MVYGMQYHEDISFPVQDLPRPTKSACDSWYWQQMAHDERCENAPPNPRFYAFGVVVVGIFRPLPCTHEKTGEKSAPRSHQSESRKSSSPLEGVRRGCRLAFRGPCPCPPDVCCNPSMPTSLVPLTAAGFYQPRSPPMTTSPPRTALADMSGLIKCETTEAVIGNSTGAVFTTRTTLPDPGVWRTQKNGRFRPSSVYSSITCLLLLGP
mmetsp:Transcript_819/g.1175  ORF Transcript_819/g.1175 Transcript_819/m.1175 type:complete len:208 (-) Transcript_819:444-1067(-)